MNPSEIELPAHWMRGQLLNVRETEEGYTLTLLYDGEYDRCKRNGIVLDNAWECQAFVSWWYSRSSEPTAVEEEPECAGGTAKAKRQAH